MAVNRENAIKIYEALPQLGLNMNMDDPNNSLDGFLGRLDDTDSRQQFYNKFQGFAKNPNGQSWLGTYAEFEEKLKDQVSPLGRDDIKVEYENPDTNNQSTQITNDINTQLTDDGHSQQQTDLNINPIVPLSDKVKTDSGINQLTFNDQVGKYNEALYAATNRMLKPGMDFEESMTPLTEYFNTFREEGDDQWTLAELGRNIIEDGTKFGFILPDMAKKALSSPAGIFKVAGEVISFIAQTPQAVSKLLTASNLNPAYTIPAAFGDEDAQAYIDNAQKEIWDRPVEHFISAHIFGKTMKSTLGIKKPAIDILDPKEVVEKGKEVVEKVKEEGRDYLEKGKKIYTLSKELPSWATDAYIGSLKDLVKNTEIYKKIELKEGRTKGTQLVVQTMEDVIAKNPDLTAQQLQKMFGKEYKARAIKEMKLVEASEITGRKVTPGKALKKDIEKLKVVEEQPFKEVDIEKVFGDEFNVSRETTKTSPIAITEPSRLLPVKTIKPQDITLKPKTSLEAMIETERNKKLTEDINNQRENLAENLKEDIPRFEDGQKIFDDFNEPIKIFGFQKIKNGIDNVHNWIWRFSEARRKHPALFNKITYTRNRLNSGIDRAVYTLDKIMKGKEGFSEEIGAQFSLMYENTKLRDRWLATAPKELVDTYAAFENVLKEFEKRQIKEDLVSGDLKQKILNNIDEKIKTLEKKRMKIGKAEKIEQLNELRTRVEEGFQYLPHTIVAKRVIESKLNRADKISDQVNFFKAMKDLSSKYPERKGVYLLPDYLEAGIIKSKDIDIRRLTAEVVDNYYFRSSLNIVEKWAKEEGMIVPKNKAPKDWYTPKDIGITSRSLENMKLHPLLGRSFKELLEGRYNETNGYIRRIFSLAKIGQFINPGIIAKYDMIQKVFSGMYSLNPLVEGRHLSESFLHAWNKDKTYQEYNTLGLFQFPRDVTKAFKQDQVQMFMDRTNDMIPNWKNQLQGITGINVKDPSFKSLSQELFMSPYRVLSNTTWFSDKVIRMSSVKFLERAGYSKADAVRIASRGHGAYGELSKSYQRTLQPFLFVHSFRTLMPTEMLRLVTDPIKETMKMYDLVRKKGYTFKDYWDGKIKPKDLTSKYDKGFDKPPPGKLAWERIGKGVGGIIAFKMARNFYMEANGWEVDKTDWKWKKTIPGFTTVDKDGNKVDIEEHEIVMSVNDVYNQGSKFFHRGRFQDPIREHESAFPIDVENLMKFEWHPMIRVGWYDIKDNRKTFSNGEKIWDVGDDWKIKGAKITAYTFSQMFAFHRNMGNAVGDGAMENEEAQKHKAIMRQGLSWHESLLANPYSPVNLGYSYVRLGLEARKEIKQQQLDALVTKLYNKEERELAGTENWEEKLDKWEKEELIPWEDSVNDWIDKDMK